MASASPIVLSARDLSKAYGPQTLFSAATLNVREGEKVGLIGANGTGKSTLLRIVAGVEAADGGVVDRRKDARILFLDQEPALAADATARQIVESGLTEWHAAASRHAEVTRRLDHGEATDALLAEQAHLAEAVERMGGWSCGHLVEEMLAKLGVRELDRPVGTMSGGERRRIALAKILVAEPTLAVLDEPTNHLDADTIEWLEEYLAESFAGAVLVVTHDRYVLDAVCDRIVELDGAKLTEFEGGYGDYLEQKAEMISHEQRVESNRQNLLRRERAWLMRGARARTTKQKARIKRAEAVIAVEAPKERSAIGLRALQAEGHRLGKTILELHALTLTIADRVLIDGLELHMVAGERIGIIGANGVGKTSLLRLVSGELAPTAGEVVRGASTRLAYFDQARALLVDDWSIFDNVAEREGAERTGGGVVNLAGRVLEMRAYLEEFQFDGGKQRQKVGSLSGGERARVALAKVLKSGANMLLLDEPTNDLDMATLAALEDMLESWPGCALLVSHDRYFLNRVATSILAFEAGGRVIRYPGNYETYRSLREEAKSDPAPVAEAPRAAQRPSQAPVPTQGATAKPLTYAERIELETLLDRITEAEASVAALEAKLADPTLYSARSADAGALKADLDAAHLEVARLTARWEHLEARREPRRG